MQQFPDLIAKRSLRRGDEVHRTALLVECEAGAFDAWQQLILATSHRPAVLKIAPRGQHPVAPARGIVQ